MTTHAEGAEDPRELERPTLRSSIPPELAAQADEYVTLEPCPGCGDLIRATLPDGWEQSVNGTPGYAIPIVGCGNPWHYVERRGRGEWLRSMGDPLEATPDVRRVFVSLRWPEGHESAQRIDCRATSGCRPRATRSGSPTWASPSSPASRSGRSRGRAASRMSSARSRSARP